MKAPRTAPAATVEIQQLSAAYYGSAATGKGTLNFNGKSHRFSVAGLGVGGMGGQKISATGDVYNLHRLRDFNGTYRGLSRGITLVRGKVHARVKNESGVVIYLKGKTSGVATSLGARAFKVALTEKR